VADRERPGGEDETVAAPISGAEPTVAAAPSGPGDRPGSLDATALTTAPGRGSSSGATTLRKVGEEIPNASIERFGAVDRGRFEVLDELARGGLGRVFRARDPRTGRTVAIKEVLRPNPDLVTRFAREALVTANLQHPSIVPVYEVGTWNGGEPFYAMKLVAGRTLDRVIAEARTIDERVALVPHVIAIADALAYAHSEHVIHRDLKPSNVIVGSYGETIVIDWGLAKNLTMSEGDGRASLPPRAPTDGETVEGSVLGTPAYMPPEQARGEQLDEHADVYAIGAILYHVLTGKRPFATVTDLADLVEHVAKHAPARIAELVPEAPAELIAIAEKAMARDASERYPTAEGLARDLRQFQAGKLVAAHSYSRMQLLRRWIARNAAAVAVASAALLVLAITGVLAFRKIASERDEARRQGAIAQVKREEAEAANTRAGRRLADTLEELGRQALVTGAPDRALPFLAASVASRGGSTPVTAVLAAHARAAYSGLVAIGPALPSATTTGALAAGGALLVLANKDGAVTAWDLAARRTRWTVDAGTALAVSPDGARFIGVALDGTVTLRAAEDGHVLDTWHIAPQGSEPMNLAWSHDSKHFAIKGVPGHLALGAPGQAALVDAASSEAATFALAYSPDDTRLVVAGAGGALALHDTRTGAMLTTLRSGAREIAAAVWLDDGRLVEGDDHGTARLWDVASGRIVRTFELGHAIYALTAAADGTWLAASGDGGLVRVWDPATGELRRELPGHGLGVDVMTRIDDLLVTGDEIGAVRAWDPLTGELVSSAPPEEELVALDVRDGLLASIGRGRQRVWRPDPDAVVRRVEAHTARLRDLVFGSDGTLYTASLDGTGTAIDVTSGTLKRLGTADHFVEQPSRTLAELKARSRANPHGARSLALSPDRRVTALALEDGRIELFDDRGGSKATWSGHTGRVRRFVVAPDGKPAYSVGDTTLRAWDVASGSQHGIATLASVGWDIALLGSGATIVTLGDDPTEVELWRASDLSRIALPRARQSILSQLTTVGDNVLLANRAMLELLDSNGVVIREAPYTLAFSADVAISGGRRLLAVGASSGKISLLDAETLGLVREMQPLGDQVIARVAWRPDGSLLAAISDRRVALFDPHDGRLLATLPDLPVILSQLAWSPDGKRLAVAGAGGTVWIWSVTPDDSRPLPDFTACVSPWQLDDTTLVKKAFDPAACALLARPAR